ncbi:MOSC domain-containing protein [Xylariomycetidae sp. FL0641]|nr:MOSC domain-containing protein [Xylariomycetidae sp. FL0641]
MKVTELYVYPIKSLRPASVPRTRLRREGLEHDRRFMLLQVQPATAADAPRRYKNIQTAYFPECTLFTQDLDADGDSVTVRYRIPAAPLFAPVPAQRGSLVVPLRPGDADLRSPATSSSPSSDDDDDAEETEVDVKLFGSPVRARRMAPRYDEWFSACLGYAAVLVYIGDARREVLAHAPASADRGGFLSSLASYVTGTTNARPEKQNKEGLAFNEAAPYLVASEASLRDVAARVPDVEMVRFRPNIIVDDAEEEEEEEEEQGGRRLQAWDEDFWGELTVAGGGGGGQRQHVKLALTANCLRCISVNIDYATGRPGAGDSGAVLKKLMGDRRVDRGKRWSPVFGRYAFLLPSSSSSSSSSSDEDEEVVEIAVGDTVRVTRRNDERDVWAWPDTGGT